MSTTYNTARKDNKLKLFEAALLAFVLVAIIVGIVICFKDKKYFEDVYTREDGFIENFTVFPLSIAFFVAIVYLVRLARFRSWLFSVCIVFAGLFSLFVAGEEISWGQRIFNVKTPEYFKEHNAQQETNLHNMILDGEKVNKIVFTWFLGAVVTFYVLILPILYRRNPKVKKFIDWAGVPVPHRNHIIAAIVLGISIGIIPSAKNSELLEMGISSIFLLILLYPENIGVFRR